MVIKIADERRLRQLERAKIKLPTRKKIWKLLPRKPNYADMRTTITTEEAKTFMKS